MADDAKARTRGRILEVAADLLERDGARAVSTRSVAAAAGIRAASLYQLFGDKDGLLAALAVHAFEEYLAEKHTLAPTGDPVADMRRGWDAHVAFGLRHPAPYLLMYGTDRPGRRPPAAEAAHEELRAFLDAAADAGHLRVAPALAADLLLAGVTGVTLTLIGAPPEDRDPDLSPKARDALVAALTIAPAPDRAPDPGLAARALALDAALRAADPADPAADPADPPAVPLRATETALLRDWLHRLAR